ncbi:hypothetical protein ACFWOB_15655 [Streptomyces sp. NPDC058420]|uniref:hypothetical protein n=1 Tax=Streptomyces sp. NPDC058420 TaxID=3346489 RepID=UPI003658B03D
MPTGSTLKFPSALQAVYGRGGRPHSARSETPDAIVCAALGTTTGKPVNFDIDVSAGDGVDWVASNKFRIEDVLAHGVKSQAGTVDGPRLGPIPQQPKIYIAALETH